MTYRFPLAGLVLCLAAMLVTGCADASVAPSRPSAVSDGVVGTAWVVTSINGQGVVPTAPPTIAFGVDGKVSGTGGCNGYSAPYEIDGGSISVGDISSTLMLCEGAASAQETTFLAALRGATTWRLGPAGALQLDGAGAILAHPAAQAPTSPGASGSGLVGAWDLAELGPTADLAHLQPTIEFTAEGRVSGFAGCNTYSGSFTTDGATLTLGPIAMTEMACQRPGSAVESDYLAALSGVTGWAIERDGRLRLDGTVPLRYTPH